jgi:CRP-like cAMP-binding protein
VRISKFIPNIGEKVLAVLKLGEYFGETALIDNFPRSATAVTNDETDETDVFSISEPDLDRVLIADRNLGYKMLWTFTKTLSRRLQET